VQIFRAFPLFWRIPVKRGTVIRMPLARRKSHFGMRRREAAITYDRI
jgi:hypothetical protein